MALYFLFTLVGIGAASMFDPREPHDWYWPPIVILIVGHLFLLMAPVATVRQIRRDHESWFSDRAIRTIYLPWFFYLLGVVAKVWYFH